MCSSAGLFGRSDRLGPALCRVLGVAWVVALFAAGSTASGNSDPGLLHVREIRWGFDGRTQPRTFIPVSIWVQNLSPTTGTWSLSLRRSAGPDRQLGAPIVTEFTLGPDEDRWIQFVPYVWDEFETWTLRWGPEDEHAQQLPAVQQGRRATVYLYPADAVAFPTGTLRTFPAELFPLSVTATDGLDGVILDHTPFWQGARARAFLEWLQRGGRVFLLHDRNGRFPQFPEALETLNDERTRFEVGFGTVERVPMSVDEIDHEFAVATFYRTLKAPPQPQVVNYSWSNVRQGYLWQTRDSTILTELASLAQFSRNWLVIYVVAITYVLVLFPGCYLVSRRTQSVAPYYAAFGSAAVIFSVAFILLGRVGGAERNRVRVAAVARELSPGVFDVTQWWTAATVSEGKYAFAHAGSGRAYTTCQDLEAVDGELYAEPEARMEAYLPPAGYRAGLHRARVRLGEGALEVRDWQYEGGVVESLEVSTQSVLKTRPRLAWLLQGTEIMRLDIDGWTVKYRPGASRQALSAYLTEPPSWARSRFWWAGTISPEEAGLDEAQRYESLAPALVAGLCGVHSQVDENVMQGLAGQVSLLVLADLNDALRVEGTQFPDQQGVVLYQFRLPGSS